MKKSLKNLELKKETISKLDTSALHKVQGGHSGCCPTEGALNSCPPPGRMCF
ncbi:MULTISPECIES: class I lanthipeptide [Aquimarina]|uniref:class I lanthipeptide n=1 Tax=Aquimarina TaxID=290174 RepID=UPI0013570CF8|nr:MULTISPECIES: class I lanthipeptide [Aquimarina]